MKKHSPYKKLEGYKKEHNITNAMIANALDISETSVVNKNSGVSDYYIGEIIILRDKLKIPTKIFT